MRLWRPSVQEEVNEELAFHVAMRTRENIARGMEPEAARAAALERFGDIDGVVAACRRLGTEREREMHRTEYLSELRQDIAFSWRQLAKAPAFTVIAVLTLALGIGATTSIFSALYAVVLRPFPYANPDRVVGIGELWRGNRGNVAVGNYASWRDETRSFESMAAIQFSSFNFAEGDVPERVVGARVSHQFFRVFGVPAALGRTFTAEEDAPGNETVVVLSHRLWTRRFGADPRIVGQTVRMNGTPYGIIGVMPARFDLTSDSEELWVPIAFTARRLAMHDEHSYSVVGRIKPGVTLAQAQADLDRVAASLRQRFPLDNAERGALATPLAELIIGDYRSRLYVLLGAVACVFLIACGNVANLVLARGAVRGKEIAIRAALGARRGRIVRQMLTESAVLGLAGGVAGLLLAAWGIRALVGASPDGVPRLDQAGVNGTVLAFALAVSMVGSLIFGVVPALRAARADLQPMLKEGGRGSGMGTPRDRVRSVLIAAEVALALTLLTGAGLLIRTAIHLQNVAPGFDPRGVLTARIALPRAQYGEHPTVSTAYRRIVEELRQQPGVLAAAAVSQAPLGGGGNSNGLIPEGKAIVPENAFEARLRITTPEIFQTLRVPLRRGRAFNDRDAAGAPRVMIVSETLARQMWGSEDPIGKRVICCEGGPEDPRWKTVVGVVGDVRSRGPAEDVRPEFYLPIEQVPPEAWDWIQRGMTLVARTDGDAAGITGALRAAVRAVDPSLPLFNVATMPERMRASTSESRFYTMLLATLGVVGVLLAAVGIYGIIAYFVAQRSQEIGIRIALGATSSDVVRLSAWHGLRPVLAGVVVGIGSAWAATRLLQGVLRGVTPTDPVTFACVVALLLVVALLASYIPARRATRVDPTRALQAT